MEHIVEWAGTSSLHGIGNALFAGRSRSVKRRHLWMLLFWSFVLFCVYFQSKLVYEILVVKPTIVQLSYEPFEDTLEGTLNLYTGPDRERSAFRTDITSFYEQITVPLRQQLVFCHWRGKDCLKDEFWKLTLTRNVFCHEFSPPQRYVTHPYETLSIVIDFEVDRGIGYIDIGGGTAMQLYFYDPSETAAFNTWDKSHSLDIAPGNRYNLGLSRKRYTDASGFSNCIQEGKEGVLKYYESGYTKELCVSECFTEEEDKGCGCTTQPNFNYGNWSEHTRIGCEWIDYIMCTQHDKAKIIEKCERKCIPQCSFTKYDFKQITWTKLSTNPILVDYYSRQTVTSFASSSPSNADRGKNMSALYMRQNLAEVVIGVNSFNVETIKILPKYEFFSATSAFGGLLGLFLGGSAVTLVELAELFAGIFANVLFRVTEPLKKKLASRKGHRSQLTAIEMINY
ncbi:epithelial sodium channel subunit gamma-2-like [Convolutriloba macropyga]|uniref:epithelial sodium channel subunit gamma-2-like n=1 Tax=Convolutriloba macropyga TaxID=536237 RepID=UPI003F51EB73